MNRNFFKGSFFMILTLNGNVDTDVEVHYIAKKGSSPSGGPDPDYLEITDVITEDHRTILKSLNAVEYQDVYDEASTEAFGSNIPNIFFNVRKRG